MSFQVFSQNKGSLFVKKDHSTSPIPLAQKSTQSNNVGHNHPTVQSNPSKTNRQPKTTPRYSRPWRKMYQGEGVVKRIFDRGGPVLLFFLASPMIHAQITLPSHPPKRLTWHLNIRVWKIFFSPRERFYASFFGRVDNWAFFYVSEVCPKKTDHKHAVGYHLMKSPTKKCKDESHSCSVFLWQKLILIQFEIHCHHPCIIPWFLVECSIHNHAFERRKHPKVLHDTSKKHTATVANTFQII